MKIDRFLRRKEVEEVTGLSRATIYRHIANGSFPAPAKLGPRAVGWRLSHIEKWIESR